jgi:YD repeat-containing protein
LTQPPRCAAITAFGDRCELAEHHDSPHQVTRFHHANGGDWTFHWTDQGMARFIDEWWWIWHSRYNEEDTMTQPPRCAAITAFGDRCELAEHHDSPHQVTRFHHANGGDWTFHWTDQGMARFIDEQQARS